MEFEEQYLTYEEYKALGGDLDLLPFNLFEFEARRIIDNRTQNRLKNVEERPQEVKICEFKMILAMTPYSTTLESIKNNLTSSENIEGYSVSYLTMKEVSELVKSKKDELSSIIYEYLIDVIVNGQRLLYAGVE